MSKKTYEKTYKVDPINQKVYVFIDSQWRFLIPRFFSFPNDNKIYKLRCIGKDCIQATFDRDSNAKNKNGRMYISVAMRKLMNLQISDAFEITHCENGYILKKVNKEDIE